jgi:hypothetical protein
MSDDEIIHFFSQPRAHTCGRFRPDQLKTYSVVALPRVNPGMTLVKASFLSLLVMLVSKQTSAQSNPGKAKTEIIQHPKPVEDNTKNNPDQIIKGVVTSNEDHGPLPGVNVYLKGSEEGTVSDAEGRFQFPRKLKEGDVLAFSFIGLETKEYVVPKKLTEVVEIPMVLCYEAMMGELVIDRAYTIRQSGFRKLWSKAKGLF